MSASLQQLTLTRSHGTGTRAHVSGHGRCAAALLIQHIIDWSREQRLDRLVLRASAEGRALYERLGFIATNEMKFAGDNA
jgi:hypothetical protein